MKLWDIVVCCVKGNDANFCGVIFVIDGVVLMHAITGMVILI